MRYPIFLFCTDDDLTVYASPDQHLGSLEIYDVDSSDIWFDSDGHLLAASGDERDEGVKISNTGTSPDPERLRSMLIHALRRKGQEWADNAPLNTLISAAQEAYGYEEGIPIGEAISNLLRFLHLKRPKS